MFLFFLFTFFFGRGGGGPAVVFYLLIFFFFFFFFILNRSRSAKPGWPVTPKYLYNETILSRFNLCLKPKVDVASVVAGSVNDVSASILLVSGVL